MPKERLTHGRIYKRTESTVEQPPIEVGEWDGGPVNEGETLHEQPSLEINWTPEQHVQFSITMSREQLLNMAEHMKQDPDRTGTAIYTEEISRYDLQKIIKFTRKARDQVYGADE